MAFWNLYFLWKAYLHWRGYIQVLVGPNLLLFGALWASSGARRPVKAVAWAAGLPLAGLLLWRESFFPTLAGTIAYLSDPAQRPGWGYLWRSLRYYLTSWPALGLGAGLALIFALRRRLSAPRVRPRDGRLSPGLRLEPAVLALYVVLFLLSPRLDRRSLESDAQDFFAAESARRAEFPARAAGPAFDVVILHVCSLSWDDLRAAGLLDDPFLKSFDYVFTGFNSVSSYSGQAASRLLRAKCGQTRHEALEKDAPEDCYLLGALGSLGYEVSSVLNHDGSYQHMEAVLERAGKAPPRMSLDGLKPVRLNFESSPIYSNRAVLGRWLDRRAKSRAKRAALYYNTASLHTGAHPIDSPASGNEDLVAEYRADARGLFADFDDFFARLRASGRKTVVLFVPEHGAALTPSKLQGRDLRDIPLPDITTVPVGIKLVAPGRSPAPARSISGPISYLALGYLLSALLEKPTFGPQGIGDEVLAGVPHTRFVAETRTTLLLEHAGNPYLYWKSGAKWARLPREFLPLP